MRTVASYDKHYSVEFFKKGFHFKNKITNVNNEINMFFFALLFNKIKCIKKQIMFRMLYKYNVNSNLFLSPTYTFLSQFFEYRTLFHNILKKNHLYGFFIYKNLFKQSGYFYDYKFNRDLLLGYNFYIVKSNINICLLLDSILSDKEFNKIGKVKLHVQNYKQDFNFNFFFNYNIFSLNITELYKINIYLYLNSLNTEV